MRPIHEQERVRLREDLPMLQLHRGDIGVVKSTWFSPQTCYEVEFNTPAADANTRAVLNESQIEPDQGQYPIT